MREYLFTGSALFSLVNGSVLLFLNPQRAINRVFFGASAWIALWFFCIAMAISKGTTYSDATASQLFFWLRANAAVAAYFAWFLWLMQDVLLRENNSLLATIRRSWGWFVVCSILASLSLIEDFVGAGSTPTLKNRGAIYSIYLLALILCAVWLLFDGWRKSRHLTGIRKIEMQLLVMAWTSTCLILALAMIMGHLFNLDWLKRSGPIWLLALHGLLLWAVCYYKVFDAKKLLFSVCQRLAFLGLLGSGALLLVPVTSRFIDPPWNLLSTTTILCSLAFAGDRPVRRWMGLDAKHLLKKPRSVIIEWARQISDEEILRIRFEELLKDWCQTNNVFILTAHDRSYVGRNMVLDAEWTGLATVCNDGWVTPEALQRKKDAAGARECREFMAHRQLGAMLATPTDSPTPSLLIALGHRHSQRPYTYPDILLLHELIELMDNILTNARVSARTAQIEKMESAAMMSRGLAHDLNNLATPVSTFLMHMEDRVKPGSAEAEVLADAKHSIRVMQDYIRESLFFARGLEPDFQKVSAGELLASTIKLTHSRAQSRGVALTAGNVTDASFTADRALMQRLLQNLIFNGIDATPRGGKVTVSAEILPPDRISISVADEGPGVPVELRDRIFEPYFTTKDTGDEIRGLGLGLAICLKISGLHGGEIDVGRAASGGAVFRVSLPLNPNP